MQHKDTACTNTSIIVLMHIIYIYIYIYIYILTLGFEGLYSISRLTVSLRKFKLVTLSLLLRVHTLKRILAYTEPMPTLQRIKREKIAI